MRVDGSQHQLESQVVSAGQLLEMVKAFRFRLELSERRVNELQARLGKLETAYLRHVHETHRGWASMTVDAEDAAAMLVNGAAETPDDTSPEPAAKG